MHVGGGVPVGTTTAEPAGAATGNNGSSSSSQNGPPPPLPPTALEQGTTADPEGMLISVLDSEEQADFARAVAAGFEESVEGVDGSDFRFEEMD